MFPQISYAQIPGATLREQLKSLERLHGVDVRGLERIGDEPARATAGDLRGQVMGLLRNYSYVVLQTSDEDIRGVRILASQDAGRPDVGARPVSTAAAPDRAGPAGESRSQVNGHTLNATLMGFGGKEYDMSLTIDARVREVVLPASMKEVLGFDANSLDDGVTKTAEGEVQAETGLLPAVRVGGMVAENVQVAFVADDAIDGRPLLGQSFLSNFNVTYDKDTAQLLLMPR
ncbi:MAG: retroviral-like aspartic protease family protein [Rhodospirillales bacterium]|nr:retroviral-like aspartic protease family protein [Rhodospirillales bacterium]